jgi:hypothetical protein
MFDRFFHCVLDPEIAGRPIFKPLAAAGNNPVSTTRMEVSMTIRRSMVALSRNGALLSQTGFFVLG